MSNSRTHQWHTLPDEAPYRDHGPYDETPPEEFATDGEYLVPDPDSDRVVVVVRAPEFDYSFGIEDPEEVPDYIYPEGWFISEAWIVYPDELAYRPSVRQLDQSERAQIDGRVYRTMQAAKDAAETGGGDV